ncbi:hypothetical protein [Tenacibaculum finnmarkense]|uniref:hypothetical protein n=1 Tax=Tenacibaculum finnmarkense TaxID=2781243 RepID=UPI000739283E|nr:hypothetical protein [Tenacibaculum finnmarkense]ALU75470.1 hypothetical protein AUW17_09430 [Tenacibaculum dicentrarchi]MBE7632875.1 hypothetical protein [Tenacibaculum finnmarkense genomovar ulcerans]MCD8422123.1 hypothetical protein [Tenacibaculum finnmarkense genomovar ulcerans]MCD8428744.1 hypothetical protein [Tenacibaculum finnmarkense genomovar ulcerans]MCG8239153.1 hypothetical protein [Tenacibaculum finnmarkense genomovar ulcerans]
MKNLNDFGVLEISKSEQQIIDGGGWISEAWKVLKEIDKGWDDFKDRLGNGWDSYGDCAC